MILAERGYRKQWRATLAAMLLAPAIAGCSSLGSIGGGGGDSTATGTPRGSSGFSLGETFSSIFGAAPKTAAATPAAAPGATSADQPELECPAVDIRQGASTLAVSTPDGGALGLRYQATFSRVARDCSREGPSIHIRVGVQGRVILGPAGASGDIKIPLRYALVQEGVEPKTIYTKLYMIPVTIGASDANVPFVNVDETMTVPMPPASDYDNYLIYVGFDPEGAAAAEPRKKPAPKAAHRQKRTPQASQ